MPFLPRLAFCHKTRGTLTPPCPESYPPQISSGVAASSVGACAAGAAADCAAPSALLVVAAAAAVPAASFAAFAFLLRGPGGWGTCNRMLRLRNTAALQNLYIQKQQSPLEHPGCVH